MVVLDTHTLLWWISAPKSLSKRAAAAIADAETIGVPTIVFWELALLTRRKRISLDRPVTQWVDAVLSVPRMTALPLSAQIAVRADGLDMHSDPADRFIVATAIEHQATLVTKDKLLRRLRSAESVW